MVFMRLLGSCGIDTEGIGDIPEIGRLSPELEMRRRLVSHALLPAIRRKPGVSRISCRIQSTHCRALTMSA
jgi:hypothetical protein